MEPTETDNRLMAHSTDHGRSWREADLAGARADHLEEVPPYGLDHPPD